MYCYVVEALGLSLYKIGVAKSVDARWKKSTDSPVPICLRAVVDDASFETEWMLHQHFREYARHGEWFALPLNWREIFPSDLSVQFVDEKFELPVSCVSNKKENLQVRRVIPKQTVFKFSSWLPERTSTTSHEDSPREKISFIEKISTKPETRREKQTDRPPLGDLVESLLLNFSSQYRRAPDERELLNEAIG